jgi:hypothetical protein
MSAFRGKADMAVRRINGRPHRARARLKPLHAKRLECVPFSLARTRRDLYPHNVIFCGGAHIGNEGFDSREVGDDGVPFCFTPIFVPSFYVPAVRVHALPFGRVVKRLPQKLFFGARITKAQ